MWWRVLFGITLLSLSVAAPRADAATVRLKNGNVMEGTVEVVAEGRVTVDMPGVGVLEFTAEDVATIDGEPLVLPEEAATPEELEAAAQANAQASEDRAFPLDAANAASYYWRAASRVPASRLRWSGDHISLIETGWHDPPPDLELILFEYADAIALFKDGARINECNFYAGRSPGAPRTRRPYSSGAMRWFADALMLEARRHEAAGEPQDALDNYILVLRVGRHFEQQPAAPLIDRMHAAALYSLVYPPMVQLLMRGDLTAYHWDQAMDELRALSAQQDEVDRVWSFESAVGLDEVTAEGWKPEIAQGEATVEDAARFLRLGRARTRLLLVGIAARIYEIQYGEPPKKLDELLTGALAAVPADPFRPERSLRYIQGGGQWRLFSIGPDRASQVGMREYSVRTRRGDLVMIGGSAVE